MAHGHMYMIPWVHRHTHDSAHNLVSLQVESLTAARSASRASAEPSDAIRVVNAVLTQIDQIKRCGPHRGVWVSGLGHGVHQHMGKAWC